MKSIIIILVFLSSNCIAQQMFDTNFYQYKNEIHFEKTYHTKFDVSKYNFKIFQILNDTTYVAELKDSIDINKMLGPIEFKYPFYVRVTINLKYNQYKINVDNIFWDTTYGTVNIEHIFLKRNKPSKKRHLTTLNTFFTSLF